MLGLDVEWERSTVMVSVVGEKEMVVRVVRVGEWRMWKPRLLQVDGFRRESVAVSS